MQTDLSTADSLKKSAFSCPGDTSPACGGDGTYVSIYYDRTKYTPGPDYIPVGGGVSSSSVVSPPLPSPRSLRQWAQRARGFNELRIDDVRTDRFYAVQIFNSIIMTTIHAQLFSRNDVVASTRNKDHRYKM